MRFKVDGELTCQTPNWKSVALTPQEKEEMRVVDESPLSVQMSINTSTGTEFQNTVRSATGARQLVPLTEAVYKMQSMATTKVGIAYFELKKHQVIEFLLDAGWRVEDLTHGNGLDSNVDTKQLLNYYIWQGDKTSRAFYAANETLRTRAHPATASSLADFSKLCQAYSDKSTKALQELQREFPSAMKNPKS